MQQHEADPDKAQGMIKVVLHPSLIYGKHLDREPLLQAMRAKCAEAHAEKCIDSAECEKDF